MIVLQTCEEGERITLPLLLFVNHFTESEQKAPSFQGGDECESLFRGGLGGDG